MPDLTPPAGGRRRAGLPALLLIGLALAPAPALARPEEGGFDPPRLRRLPRMRTERLAPPPATISGYLPRNANVPMYNEPPGLRTSGGPAW